MGKEPKYHDARIYLFAVVGMFIYCACKGSGKNNAVPRTKEEEWADELKRREKLIQQAKESGKDIRKCGSNIAWLYNHRQEEED